MKEMNTNQKEKPEISGLKPDPENLWKYLSVSHIGLTIVLIFFVHDEPYSSVHLYNFFIKIRLIYTKNLAL